MSYRIGRYTFVSREYLDELIKEHILAEYDISPEAREKYDLKMEFNKEGKRIKATREEIAAYWSSILNKHKKGVIE